MSSSERSRSKSSSKSKSKKKSTKEPSEWYYDSGSKADFDWKEEEEVSLLKL